MLFGIEWDTSSTLAFAMSIIPILLVGGITTIKATVIGFLLAMVLGLVLAGLKGMPVKIISWPASFVLEFLRGTPLLIQLFFVFYVLPQVTGWLIPAFVAGAIALALQYSAYCAEVYRAGIEAVPYGQREASRALNLPPLHTFTYIIIPQAIPRVIPALGNYVVSIIKDTPVLSAITVLEMLSAASIIGDRTFNYMVPLTIVGAMYLILTVFAATLVRIIDAALPKQGIPLK
ncbi:MAG TPA: ectoine/hydroxyectoine ABC transporter permease subunit EhuD [Salinisphaeraceae bacterium]|nr:ectoine/hydroxyectoine ABC transporter permease subunit EhuD [Salinisphaeraceae bacterium]